MNHYRKLFLAPATLLFSLNVFSQGTQVVSGHPIYNLNGNIGIGTNNPSTTLHVAGATTLGGNLTMSTSVIDGSENRFSFITGGASDHSQFLMYNGSIVNTLKLNAGGDSFFNGGNLVVGANSTSSKFEVFQASNTEWATVLKNVGGNGKGLLIKNASGNATPSLQINDNLDNIRFLVRSDGKVGIGTATPDYKLDVTGNARFTSEIIANTSIYLGTTNLTRISTDGNHEFGINYNIAGSFNYYSGTTSQFKIDPNGNVGIATTTPQARLHIEGGSVQIGSSTENGMLHLGGGKGYAGLGSTRSDAGLILGKNIYARYDNASYNGKALAGQTTSTGFSGIKLGLNGQMDFFGKPGNVTADEEANHIDNIRLSINTAGNVGIGTTTPSDKLEVNGTIRSKKVRVDANGWPDYVFDPDYNLKPLGEVEAYIQTHKHLPEVPSAKEVEAKGLDLGSMDATLLKKVEELTLYILDMNKKIEAMQKELNELKSKGQ